MLDDYGFDIYEENVFPIAYLITFRTFGTWLHGDARGSYSRPQPHRTTYMSPNVPLNEKMQNEMKQQAVVLNRHERSIVHEAIVEVCQFREYDLKALNVRSNHSHSVVSKAIKPEKIVNDFKVYATRRLRSEGLFLANLKVWARGASTRYLWKPRQVEAAIDYVLYSQGDVPFELVTELPDDELK